MLRRHVRRLSPWVAALALAACESTTLPPLPEPDPPPPAQIRVELVEPAVPGVVGEQTPGPVFRALNVDGSPASGATVTFSPLSGGGLEFATAVADANGLVSPGFWTLGPRPGTQWVSATAIGPGIRASVLACEVAPCPPEPEEEE